MHFSAALDTRKPSNLQADRVSAPHTPAARPNPTGAWVMQQVRNLSFTGILGRTRFLIHDRATRFSGAFDELFRSEGSK